MQLQNEWEEQSTKARLASLTKESYAKAVTVIEGLEVGTDPGDFVTGCSFTSLRGTTRAPSIACEGWIGPLSSGRPFFGTFSGISNGMIFGTNVYGYLYRNSILVPRYALIVQGERIKKTTIVDTDDCKIVFV